MDDQILKMADDIFRPVMESSIVLAANYSKKCNRNGVTVQDICYAMKFCARHMTGKHLGTMYPEIYEESESDEDESEYIVDDSEVQEFTRYSGDDDLLKQVNECYDSWDTWEPESEAHRLIKNAVDKYGIQSGHS